MKKPAPVYPLRIGLNVVVTLPQDEKDILDDYCRDEMGVEPPEDAAETVALIVQSILSGNFDFDHLPLTLDPVTAQG